MDRQEESWLMLANELADRTRTLLRRRFRERIPVEFKPDGTPVTSVDREVESLLRDGIRRACPEHGILGEEEGADAAGAEYVWVLDPIDGTKAFLSRKPVFGTLIALVRAGHPFLGVIDAPITGERWTGLDGEGAFKDGERIRVRERRPLSRAVLCSGSPRSLRRAGRDPDGLHEAVAWTNYQVDCYGYGLLAQGDVDLVVEGGLHPYDFCALDPIVRNAGGTMTHWNGEPLGLDGDGTVVAATSPGLAREALALL